MRVAFDIGGVVSKYPDKFRDLMLKLHVAGVSVLVITDMHEADKVHEMLVLNGFDFIPKINIFCADYKTHGEGCKAELLKDLAVDLFFDDFIGYVALPSDTIQCLVMPNPYKPYWADSWVVPEGEQDFGRRFYKKPKGRGP